MGHSQCGAVTATLNALQNPGKPASPNISDIESGQVTVLDDDKPADRAAEPPPPRSEALLRPREPDGIEGGQRRGSRGVL
jgi:hypothetical protein